MVALYYRGVPISFAEGVGARVREGFHLILHRLSPLQRSQCVIDYYSGPFPLSGDTLRESLDSWHELICPIADGMTLHACEKCEGEADGGRRAYL
jgi:hypothetical protein